MGARTPPRYLLSAALCCPIGRDGLPTQSNLMSADYLPRLQSETFDLCNHITALREGYRLAIGRPDRGSWVDQLSVWGNRIAQALDGLACFPIREAPLRA